MFAVASTVMDRSQEPNSYRGPGNRQAPWVFAFPEKPIDNHVVTRYNLGKSRKTWEVKMAKRVLNRSGMGELINLSVVNGNKFGFQGANRHYIGRFNARRRLAQSALANSFHIGKDGDREMVIKKYRDWLWTQMQEGLIGRYRIKAGLHGESNAAFSELMMLAKRVMRGENLELACYCSPLACHGDVIIRAINWLIQENLVDIEENANHG